MAAARPRRSEGRGGGAGAAGGARPFAPGEAPLGVRPGLGGPRRRAGATPQAPIPSRADGYRGRRAASSGGGPFGGTTLSRLRLAALCLLLGTVLVSPIALASSSLLPLRTIDVRGTALLDADVLRGATGITLGSNLFAANLPAATAALMKTPLVAHASLRIALPDRLVVDVVESPLLMRWRVGSVDWLVDGEGRVVGAADDPALAPGATTTISSLPVVDDRRAAPGISVGSQLPALVVDVATRLVSLTPIDVGSHATSLSLQLIDGYGFTLMAGGSGVNWSAVFGIYSSTIRPPDMVPGQVRLLRSLLAGREAGIGWVLLADEQAGTYTPRGVQPPPPSFVTATPSPPQPPSGSGVTP